MKMKEIFGLAVRILGLVFLYHGLQAIPLAMSQIINSFPHQIGMGMRQSGSFSLFFMSIVMVAWPLLLSFWLIGGAPLINRRAYPDTPPVIKNDA